MTINQFLSKIKELNIVWYDYSSYYSSINDNPTANDCLFLEWQIGGQSGGSCWDEGSSRYYPLKSEKEPEFQSLDLILTELCPNINITQYKTLCNAVIKYDERSVNEYYGNYTDYGIKRIRFGDLYENLTVMGLIGS